MNAGCARIAPGGAVIAPVAAALAGAAVEAELAELAGAAVEAELAELDGGPALLLEQPKRAAAAPGVAVIAPVTAERAGAAVEAAGAAEEASQCRIARGGEAKPLEQPMEKPGSTRYLAGVAPRWLCRVQQDIQDPVNVLLVSC